MQFGKLLWSSEPDNNPRVQFDHFREPPNALLGDVFTVEHKLGEVAHAQSKQTDETPVLIRVDIVVSNESKGPYTFPADWSEIKEVLQRAALPKNGNSQKRVFRMTNRGNEVKIETTEMPHTSKPYNSKTEVQDEYGNILYAYFTFASNAGAPIYVLSYASTYNRLRSSVIYDFQSAQNAARILTLAINAHGPNLQGDDNDVKELRSKLNSESDGKTFKVGEDAILSIDLKGQTFLTGSNHPHYLFIYGDDVLKLQTPTGTFVISTIDQNNPEAVHIIKLKERGAGTFGRDKVPHGVKALSYSS